jgi:hypothetical protein
MGKLSDAAVAGIWQTKQGDLSEQTQPATWWEPAHGTTSEQLAVIAVAQRTYRRMREWL